MHPRRNWLSIVTTCCFLATPVTIGAQGSSNASHKEAQPIQVDLGNDGKLETIGMDAQGRILAVVSAPKTGAGRSAPNTAPPIGRPGFQRGRPGFQRQRPGFPRGRPGGRPGSQGARTGRSPAPGGSEGPRQYAIRVLNEDGKQLDSWSLGEIGAKMLLCCDDGDVYVGSIGKLARLNAQGKIVQKVDMAKLGDGRYGAAHISGLAANADFLFVAFGEGRSTRATEDIVRLKRDFTQPKLIVEKQFGCCMHIDMEVKGKELLVAENSRHRVNRFTLDGQLIARWGSRDRTGIEGFAACCNPVNMDFAADGSLITAESGVGRVKRYAADGSFLGVIGYVDTTKFDRGSRLAATSCYIPVEVAPDGKKIFVMDVRANFIRVLKASGS